MMKELDLNQDLSQKHLEQQMETDSFALFFCAPVSLVLSRQFGLVWFGLLPRRSNNDCNLQKAKCIPSAGGLAGIAECQAHNTFKCANILRLLPRRQIISKSCHCDYSLLVH